MRRQCCKFPGTSDARSPRPPTSATATRSCRTGSSRWIRRPPAIVSGAIAEIRIKMWSFFAFTLKDRPIAPDWGRWLRGGIRRLRRIHHRPQHGGLGRLGRPADHRAPARKVPGAASSPHPRLTLGVLILWMGWLTVARTGKRRRRSVLSNVLVNTNGSIPPHLRPHGVAGLNRRAGIDNRRAPHHRTLVGSDHRRHRRRAVHRGDQDAGEDHPMWSAPFPSTSCAAGEPWRLSQAAPGSTSSCSAW